MNNVYRLGLFRRNKRDYAVEQRPTGKDSKDRMKEKLYIFYAAIISAIASTFLALSEKNIFISLMKSVAGMLTVVCDIRRPRLADRAPIPQRRLGWEDLTDTQYTTMLGLSKVDAQEQYIVMNFPNKVMLNEGRHAFGVDGVHAFLYYMYRIHTPNQRVQSEEDFWGYHHSVLSKILWAEAKFVDAAHGHRLRQLPNQVHHFKEFNAKIRQKISNVCPFDPIPPHAMNCALFGDGIRFRTARPSGPYWVQYGAFSGDKWFHCHGAQAIYAPDGMFYDWYDEPLGKDSDKFFMRESGVNEILRDCQLNWILQYWVYCDAGYNDRSHIRAATHGPGPVTDQEVRDNAIMAKFRVCIEWGFSKLKYRCPYLNHPSLLKLQAVDVALLVRACVIMTNAHTCQRQSQTGLYFDCQAPTLTTYFA